MSIFIWTATFLSLLGNYYVNRKNVCGMWLWLIGTSCWVIIALIERNWPQLVLFTVYQYFNIEGILKWRGENGGHKDN